MKRLLAFALLFTTPLGAQTFDKILDQFAKLSTNVAISEDEARRQVSRLLFDAHSALMKQGYDDFSDDDTARTEPLPLRVINAFLDVLEDRAFTVGQKYQQAYENNEKMAHFTAQRLRIRFLRSYLKERRAPYVKRTWFGWLRSRHTEWFLKVVAGTLISYGIFKAIQHGSGPVMVEHRFADEHGSFGVDEQNRRRLEELTERAKIAAQGTGVPLTDEEKAEQRRLTAEAAERRAAAQRARGRT